MTTIPIDPLLSQPCILGHHLSCPESRCECRCHMSEEPLWPDARRFGLLRMLRRVGGGS